MKIHHLSVSEGFATLRSCPTGLTLEEARRRLTEFGHNELEEVARQPWWRLLAEEFVHFFALILWIAAALAFFAEWRQPGAGMGLLGVAIVGVILVNGLFGFWQIHKAEETLRALQKLLPGMTKTLREGESREIPVGEVVPGDIVLLDAGDRVPADCRLVESAGARVNNATITGESVPHARDAEPCQEPELMEARNILLAGTFLAAGQAKALVFATGPHTAFGRIAHLTQTTSSTPSPLQLEITRMSRLIAVLAFALGAIVFIVGRAIGLSFWGNFLFAIGIIVANVPEGLLPTVTLALAMASQRMARRNALIRHLPAVEALGCTTVICTDKTGTLTMNCMAPKRLFLAGSEYSVSPGELAQLRQSHERFFEIAACCHDLKRTRTPTGQHWLGDPMEVALLELATSACPIPPSGQRIGEIPFDSGRRRLSTIHRCDGRHRLYCKGAPEVLLPRCSHVAMEKGLIQFSPAVRDDFLAAVEKMAVQGLRVLALAWRDLPDPGDLLHAEEAMTLAGLVGFEDPPRPEVPNAVQRCEEAGIKIIMVTGDHPQTAEAIGREIGLIRSERPVLMTGEQIARLSDAQLQLALDAEEIVFARVAAEQKMRIVSILKRKREIVAVTGDGVNDAPALRQADVGVAMGKAGTDVAREAADMVLLDDNFASIAAAVEEGRAVFCNIRKFLTYILTSNVPEIVPYVAFALFRIPLPLTVMQILAVDLGTDMMPALALGAEKPEAGVMKCPPRPRTERLLNWPLLARAYFFLGFIQAAGSMSAYFFVLYSHGWSREQVLAPSDPVYREATTACLGAIVLMQMANVFLCRSDRRSLPRKRVWDNKLLFAGVAVEAGLILAIVYTPWGNMLFGTSPLPFAVWLFIAPFVLGLILMEAGRKWMMGRTLPGRL